MKRKNSCQFSVKGLIEKRQAGRQLQSTCFPTHRKERDGWGTQFHPLWADKAGGLTDR
jgi:hypothetical protein